MAAEQIWGAQQDPKFVILMQHIKMEFLRSILPDPEVFPYAVPRAVENVRGTTGNCTNKVVDRLIQLKTGVRRNDKIGKIRTKSDYFFEMQSRYRAQLALQEEGRVAAQLQRLFPQEVWEGIARYAGEGIAG